MNRVLATHRMNKMLAARNEGILRLCMFVYVGRRIPPSVDEAVPGTQCAEMCVDICIGICAGMYVYGRVYRHVYGNVYGHVCRCVYRHVHRHEYRNVYA